ncbi:MAG: flavin reductase family protein [Candidatus Marinimicrobia bacterium]|nr:flavin reductase family protein [Candidatus Neomarinimicrobiota bacterium]
MTKDINHQGYPKIVTIVGAKYKDKTNFMTAAWSTYLSHNPLLFGVSIASQRFTHDLIENSKEFNGNIQMLVEIFYGEIQYS